MAEEVAPSGVLDEVNQVSAGAEFTPLLSNDRPALTMAMVELDIALFEMGTL